MGSIILALLALAAALLAAGVFVEARRILSWVIACAVVAALIELIVDWLDRWMKRAIAIVLVLLTIGGVAGLLVFGVFHDLDTEARRLRVEAPLAAQTVEADRRLGPLAREIDLDRRVTEVVRQSSAPSSGLAGNAVSSFGTYAVCIVLTILFLSWGPRLANAAIKQLRADTAVRVRSVTHAAFGRARRYVVLAIAQAMAVGICGWATCMSLGLPAPLPLASILAACAMIPSLGIVLGALPILLLTAGLESGRTTTMVVAGIVILQVLSNWLVLPRIVRISGLYVGSAAVVIGGLIGFELYGIGGALYAAALMVLAVALIDAGSESETKPEPTSPTSS